MTHFVKSEHNTAESILNSLSFSYVRLADPVKIKKIIYNRSPG